MDYSLSDTIQSIYPLPKDVLEEFVGEFTRYDYPKHFFLLRQGQVCKHLWFAMSGVIRHFHITEQGKEMNTWFGIDLQVITETSSLVTQAPSMESIQLLEESVVFAVPYERVQYLLTKHHSFSLWYIKLVEQFYVTQIEDRLLDLQFLDATQRYQKLLEMYPEITNRISLGHIASYLNITQETLSRIRAGKA